MSAPTDGREQRMTDLTESERDKYREIRDCLFGGDMKVSEIEERDGRHLAWACECECGECFWTDGYPGDAFCPFCGSDQIAFVPPENTIQPPPEKRA